MSNTKLMLNGFEEFKQQLRNLPAHLAVQAGPIVVHRAEAAADQIRVNYPERTGKLRQGVKVDRVAIEGAGAVARVRSTAKIAFIVENGTQLRHTKEGWNRGAMPPGHYFVPVVVRERRRMFEELIALLQSEGLTVTGRG